MTCFEYTQDFEIDGYVLKLTCGGCPEQYDVFFNGVEAGYLRLRHGSFTATYPNPSGEEVYHALPEGDGIFEPEERERYLREAIKAIHDFRRFSGPVKAFFD